MDEDLVVGAGSVRGTGIARWQRELPDDKSTE
jgi:hypothetical protein